MCKCDKCDKCGNVEMTHSSVNKLFILPVRRVEAGINMINSYLTFTFT